MSKRIDPRKQKRLDRKAKVLEQRARKRTEGTSAPQSIAPTGTEDGRLALRFEPLDTWFFRESRPHNAVGASDLSSLFPPPSRTLAGAIRSLVGETSGIEWQKFTQADPLTEVIGYGDDLGPLEFDGPWLDLHGEAIFPAPAFLLGRGGGAERAFKRLAIGGAVQTDLGADGASVHLPEIPGGERGYAPLEGTWLTAQGMACVLAGGLPGVAMLRDEQVPRDQQDRHEQKGLFVEEPRLGIARQNSRRTAIDAQLYQTRHLRPNTGLGVTVGLRGLDKARLPARTTLVRLGGEGRMAALSWQECKDPVSALRPKLAKRTRGLILLLLTPADLHGHWLPPRFEPCEGRGCWAGEINGVDLRIHAAVLGKARREGGWDQAAGAPRTVRSLIPPGSAWYCTADGDMAQAITALHGSAIGCDRALGRGRLAVGLWSESEFPKELNT